LPDQAHVRRRDEGHDDEQEVGHRGGPGTATQSLTLQAWIDWNTLNLGRSAAVAYLLLIMVTIVATLYVSYVRRRVTTIV